MRSGIVRIWFVASLILAGVALTSPVHAKPKDPAYRDGEVIIKFRSTASNAERQSILADLGALDVKDLRPTQAKHARIGRLTVDAAIKKYKNHPKVQYIEPNYILHTALVPNDPAFGNLWGLQNLGQTGGTPGADIRATNAWDVTTGSSSVLVAVIDTGVDYTHADLAANIFSNAAEASGLPGVDDDGNGFIDDVRGWDFVNNDNDPMDDHNHGTHCSGTIGGVGNNGIGVAGVNWTVKILPVKFLNAGGSGTTAGAILSVDYATRMHVDIMSNSWGGGGFSQALLDAINAANDAGIIFVAAAGNFSSDNDISPFYPATYDAPNVISVAATDHNDGIASFSNFGLTTVDLGAPGVDVYSTLPGNSYGTFSGTSMACPHVAGACALVRARFPGSSVAAVKNLIMRFAHPIPALAGRTVTGGRLDAFMTLADPDSTPPGGITDLAVTMVEGTRVRLQWTSSGDDGPVGRASRYELRYSTSPITPINFDSATLVAGPPNPEPAGTVQDMEVRGLSFETGYFFAIVPFDEFDNRGPLSNVPFATTPQGPEIDVSPLSMTESLLTGQTATQVLTIRNTGVSELNWEIAVRGTSDSTAQRPVTIRTGPIRPRIDEPRPTNLPDFRTDAYAVAKRGNRASEESARLPWMMNSMPAGDRRVLLIESGSDVSDIQSRLSAFPDLVAVDVFHAGTATPQLSELIGYDAVILLNNQAFSDGNSLGNVLADYSDAGGTVILTIASIVSGFHVGGRFLAEGYSPFELGTGPVGFASLGAYDASHPIMAGVSGVGGDLLAMNSLSSGSELVASWSTGQPFIATKGGNVAAVNVFLPFGGFWVGDVPLILHNAVQWAGHSANWASAVPNAGVVPVGASVAVAVTFDANDLDGGDYHAVLEVNSDDPDESTVPVALSLHVTGAPNIVVSGAEVHVESTQDFFGDGASTNHTLASDVAPSGGGEIELIADGDFGFGPEVATLTVEGVLLGSTSTTGTDCSPARRTFPIDEAQLATFLADGHVDCLVQNDIEVNTFCIVNNHTVRLNYSGTADSLNFGSPFVGGHRDVSILIRNTGTDPLVVSGISSNRPEFVPDAASMTIGPRSNQALRVRFSPLSAGSFSGTLHIASNDADSPSIDIAMTGVGLDPPIAGVDPTSFAVTLNEGETANRSLRLSNSGLSPLTFTVEVRSHAPDSTIVSRFAGLGAGVSGISNNAPAHANAGTNGLEREGEPTYRALVEEFELLSPSPQPVTCVVEDRAGGYLYGQANFGNAFYRYSAATRSWETLATSPIFSGNNGGAALLSGKVYTTYTDTPTIGIYDIATGSWSSRPTPLPFGSCNVASDGTQYLYLLVATTFERLDPATGVFTPLASPPFYFEPWGGMKLSGTTIFAHQGNGTQGFAKYDITTNLWTILPAVPGGAVAGAAIDPVANEYVAYGSYGGTNMYRYSILNSTWSVATIPLFSVNDGGLGFLPSLGVLFVQGESGTGFGRVGSGQHPVTVTPISGAVEAGASLDLDVLFNSAELFGGVYPEDIRIASNDPVNPLIEVPATLTVIGIPNLQVEGAQVEVVSAKFYSGSGAATTHRLDTPSGAEGGGTLSILAEGEYGDLGDVASVTAEGLVLGTTSAIGFDCAPTSSTFALDAAQLAGLLADGHVDVLVQNSIFVDDFCPVNRHTITLRYRARVSPIDFGTLFVGTTRDLSLAIRNTGSSALECTFASNRPEFTLSSAAFTVPPREMRPLGLHFAPGSPATFNGTLHITSNDPDTPTVDFALVGNAVMPPIVSASPESVSVTVNEGDGATRTLTISNGGPSPLDFTLEVLPGSAASVRSPFRGLSAGVATASNNPPRTPDPITDAAGRTGEPRFHAADADFELRAPSPEPLTCVAADPTTGAIYGQANFGTSFYRYDAASNTWSPRTSSPIFSGNNGGAAYLNGKIYTSYTQNPFQLGVYDIAANSWGIVSAGSSFGTGNIASDGTRFLYLVSSFELIRIDPESLAVAILPPPPFPFSPWGGLQYVNGILYAHVGNGSASFAQFDLGSGSWSALAAMPGPAVLGSAYDPNAGEYVAYGGYGGTNFYRFNVNTSSWTVNTVPFFSLNDGGIAWIGGALQGLYFVQGENGTGFARTGASANFLTLSTTSGTVPPLGSVPINLRFESGTLGDGTYRARVGISSNDPVRPHLDVRASMRVIGVPNLFVEGDEVELESSVDYTTDGALTSHDLVAPAPFVGGSGTLSLTADGDFGDFAETATLSAEGITFGSVGTVIFDCTPATGSFPVSAPQLAALLADGHLQAQVQNSPDVNVFCATNRHVVRLNYRGAAGPLDFGSVFVGATRVITLTARNLGSLPLVISSITSNRSVFTATPSSFTVPPRSSATFQVQFAPLAPGSVSGTLTINSNDTDQPSYAIGISGVGLIPPVAGVTPASFLETLYPGGTLDRTLTIGNTGGSDLDWSLEVQVAAGSQVESVSPAFSGASSRAPSKTLATPSGRPAESELYSSPVTRGVPDATGKPPAASMDVTGSPLGLAPKGAGVAESGPSVSADPTLEQIQAALDLNYGAVTSIIPNRFDFFEGDVGSSIGDGGFDMYDGGNFLGTNFGGYFFYTNGPIDSSAFLGSGGRYFTKKYPGLFVFAADIRYVSDFIISGNLGADGGGITEGAVFTTRVAGREFVAFSKRTYNAGDPSVNHLIILENRPGLMHQFSFNTDDDFHTARALDTSTRMYYILYASQLGGYINNAETMAILEAFLGGIGLAPEWLTVSAETGRTPAGGTTPVNLHFDATDLDPGDHFARLALHTNDPLHSEIDVPVQLHVVGRPALTLGASSLDFGTTFVGYSETLSMMVSNPGSETLIVSSMTPNRSEYAIVPSSFSLAAHESTFVQVTFTPPAVGPRDGIVTIISNDPDSPHSFAVTGSGLLPPVLSMAGGPIVASVSPGGHHSETLRICNTGGSDLEFSIRAIQGAAAPAAASATATPTVDLAITDGRLAASAATVAVGAVRGQQPGSDAGGTRPRIEGVGGPDTFGYTWRDSDDPSGPAYGWIDIQSIGTQVPFTSFADDESRGPFPIGFGFRFYATTFTTFNVSSNGFISFTSRSTRSANVGFPNSDDPTVPENVIAPFWDDLVLAAYNGSKVYYHSDGNRLVVQFVHASRFGDSGGANDFEIILYRSGRIICQYQTLGVTRTSSTVGIQNEIRNDGLTVVNNASYLHNNLAIEIAGAPTWLAVNPSDGVVPAGGCVDVEVQFDATDLALGTYEAQLRIGTNDPARPSSVVDVTLHVQDAVAADVTFSPRTLNASGNGKWVKARLSPRPPYTAADVVISSVRLNGVIAADPTSGLVSSEEVSVTNLNLQFDRSQVATLLPAGDSIDVVVTGNFTDGKSFIAHDNIRVIQPRITSPNGSEVLHAGASHTVRWTVPSEFTPGYVDVLWSSDGGISWTMARSHVSGTSTAWTVPNVATTTGRMRVHLYDVDGLTGVDVSDANFVVIGSIASLEGEAPIRTFALRQNSPNPFRQGTAIEFDLPRETPVRCTVFDMAGRSVRVLANGVWPVGRHQVRWNGQDDQGRGLAPGIYLYRFEAGSFVETRRMVMLE